MEKIKCSSSTIVSIISSKLMPKTITELSVSLMMGCINNEIDLQTIENQCMF